MNKDIQPRNASGNPHGYWEIYRADGRLIYSCTFDDSILVGYDEYHNYVSGVEIACIYTYFIR